MTTLTAEQIAGVVKYGAGNDPMGRSVYKLFKPDTDGPIFVAIALAESSGDTTNTHKNPNGTTDYGLWQINSVHSALLSGGDWQNPTANFQMADSLYVGRGGKFLDWTTYNDGTYAVHLPAAQKAWGNPDTSQATHSGVKDTTDTVDSAVAGAISASEFLAKLTQPGVWIRIGEAAAGVILIVVVVAAMMKTHLPGPLGAVTRMASKAKAAEAVTEGIPK